MKKFDYLKPKTLDETLTLLAKYGDKAKLIAGGTDVIVMIKQKQMSPDALISLQGIPGLDQIQYDGTLRIGPMATHRAIEKSKLIRKEFSALTDAVDYLGSIQIRNVATIGGNICTAAPSADARGRRSSRCRTARPSRPNRLSTRPAPRRPASAPPARPPRRPRTEAPGPRRSGTIRPAPPMPTR